MSRLEAWYCGELEDDELTDAEIEELRIRVNTAVMEKILARKNSHTFPAHKTVQ